MLNNLSDWELKELYEDYIEMRESIDAPINEKGLKLLIKRNERLTNGDKALQKALLEAAILNQWKSVYLPNEQDANNNTHIAERKRFYGV